MVVSPPLVMVRDTVSRMHKPHPEHWQKTIVMHKKAHGQEYVSPKTGRIHRVMIPKAVIEKVHAYISQLTVTESPDSRESDPNRRYMIEPGMAISKLHANYVEWLKNNHPGVAAVSLSKFREIYKN